MNTAYSLDPEEVGDEEVGGPSRGSSHAMRSQRRLTKQRARVRTKRNQANMAANKGMHLRRNKRSGW